MLKFCLQITTVQKGLTTQERQNWVKKIKQNNNKNVKVLPSDNNSPNRTDYPRETEL